MNRQARRAAQRAQEKAKSPLVDGVPIGIVLAQEVPVHDQGEWPLRDGWVSKRDAAAWHEAAHVIVWLHYGHRVPSVTLEGYDTEEGASGDAYADPGQDTRQFSRQIAASVLAGPAAVLWIRSDALQIPDAMREEMLSPRDLTMLEGAKVMQGAPANIVRVGGKAAAEVLPARRVAFGALVRALLEHTTLNEEQIMAIWNEATQVAL